VDFFDDETSRAPADAGGPPSAPSSRRRPSDRRRTRVQRLIILAFILFAVVFGIAWWARSCQHNRKVGSYQTYFNGVSSAIGDSDALGRQVNAIMLDPTKLSRSELTAKLGQLSDQQAEIAVRAGRLQPPASLDDQQSVFATGMKVRAGGFQLLKTLMLAALSSKKVSAKDITALDGYFSGPDAYYQQLVYVPAQKTMQDDGVSGVAVPASTYYLTWKALDGVTVKAALSAVGTTPKLTGIHGVALVSVLAKSTSGNITLTKGRTNNVPASPDLAFVATVQNGGNATEHNVPVTATLTLPGGATVKQTVSIASIDAGKTQDATLTNFTIPTTALSKVLTLKVEAGPVQGEQVVSNNSASYKLILQLK
jgi:hypothetical protein